MPSFELPAFKMPQPGQKATSHTRDPSLSRDGNNSSVSMKQLAAGSAATMAASSTTTTPPGSSYQNRPALDRKPSVSYGHHRQTSIVHGVHHSRGSSFANGHNASPLSPQASTSSSTTAGLTNFKETNTGDLSSTSRPAPGLESKASFNSQAPTLANEQSSPAASSMTQSHDAAASRRLDRTQSVKVRKDQTHAHAQSRPPGSSESKTVGEYALHHLFNAFATQAEQKLKICAENPLGPEPSVEEICGLGVDPALDQLISALGHVARSKPKPLIDTVMIWRKDRSEDASRSRLNIEMYRDAASTPALTRRTTESSQSDALNSRSNGLNIADRQAIAVADRRASAAVYLLCRVLTEVIKQSNFQSIGPEMVSRLEDIIFIQLKHPDTDQLITSPLKSANWTMVSHLLGTISEISFSSVCDRFFTDLEDLQRKLNNKQSDSREGELELVIRGIQHICFKTSPDDAWKKACEFMLLLSKFFNQSHGQRLKQVYCSTIGKLLCSIAEKATIELNMPAWKTVIDVLGPRVTQLLSKPRYWQDAFPLFIIILCVSSSDVFLREWGPLTLGLQSKLKDRTTRIAALHAICRLTWTYVYRASDSPTITAKRLEDIIKLVFPSGRKAFTSTEPAIAEPLIQFIRIIGFKYPDLCFRNIIFPLINSETLIAAKETRVDILDPDRMVIGIRAFLMIMSDLEKGETGRPPFPVTFSIDSQQEKLMYSSFLSRDPRSKVSPVSLIRQDRLSKPVLTTNFTSNTKEYYTKFCEVLGKITLICDNAFGGQAVLDEKFSGLTPKTPISDTFSFGRREDHQAGTDHRQGFYDLLHVAVQALPRCLSPHIPFSSLVNLLCTGTAHVQSNIAMSSAQSLKSIARQGFAQQTVIGFSRFIFNFDDRYSTMSDGGMLGAGHIESTLQLYVELLQIWIEEIQQKTLNKSNVSDAAGMMDTSNAKLDRPGIFTHVDGVESHALFFLCSQSRRVRFFAITILRLITEFDAALGGSNSRIINILEKESSVVLDFKDEQLSVAERSRLQRGLRKGNNHHTLVELCCSEGAYDTVLWYKIFPNFIRISFDRCPLAVSLGREIACERLMQMYRTIIAISEAGQKQPYTPFDIRHGQAPARTPVTLPETIVDQFKLYLIFACTTLTNIGQTSQTSTEENQHVRKSSKSSQPPQEKMNNAKSLFSHIVPLLSVGTSSIREAVVVSLGSINVNLYKALLDSLRSAVVKCSDDAKMRIHQRSTSSPRRNQRTDVLRTEISQVYRLTSHFLEREEIYNDDWILQNLVTYTKDLKIFLSDAEVQNDWEFQRLRRHYCGLLEELFKGINRTKDPGRWMPFEARKSAFTLMEDWCGYSPNVAQMRQREEFMRQNLAESQRDSDRMTATGQMEIEKRDLRLAALSAMAALCAGPVAIMTEGRTNLQFDVRRMLTWIDAILGSSGDKTQLGTSADKTHAIGRRALKNLITHNPAHTYLLDHAIEQCYVSESSKSLESFFEVISQVLLEKPEVPSILWRVIGVALFALGEDKSHIRSKSAHLLRVAEERSSKNSKIQDFDVSVADKTPAVYKLAQFEISKRLAIHHQDISFHLFSDLARNFKVLRPSSQRNMIAAMLPWLQTIELQVAPNGGLTPSSYMLLANLFEITIKFGALLHNEVQALWQALATGPHGGNVQSVLDFMIQLCLEKREQNFVDYSKQIVVFLSSTPAGSKVVEFLLMQVTPKTMPLEKRESLSNVTPEALSQFPYTADLNSALPIGTKQAGYSLGQLSLILLVDLMISPLNLSRESVPLLLQAIFVLRDHYITLVQQHAREMLIHLVHELVISKFTEETPAAKKKVVEGLIEAIRGHDSEIIWAYDDNGNGTDDSESRVPKGMENLASQVLQVFSIPYPELREQWGKTTLTWATSCPVRHLACRSFQLFRCVLTSLDQPMLGDMLARLSNTISDNEVEVVPFSMEILTTLKIIIADMKTDALLQYPQLFWATCACLRSIHEREFLEALLMLENYMAKVDLSQPDIVAHLTENLPTKWEGSFDGLQPLIYKGLRSSASLSRTTAMLEKLVKIPDNALVGDSSRILFSFLASIPRFLQAIDDRNVTADQIAMAQLLASAANAQSCPLVSQALEHFASNRFRASKDFINQSVLAIRESFFPVWDFKALVFLIGLLTNQLSWYKSQTMRLLCILIPDIDMRKPEIASRGPDLITPLLRLLQTEHCSQALDVLDNVMIMSGTPNDKHHLRASIVGAHSRARKDYDRLQSLFGIPEDSGWAIAVPAAESATTRANVHAVFYTCANAETTEEHPAPTPEVEFQNDDFQYGFPFPDRPDALLSEIEHGNGDPADHGNMGDLVQKLDSLDDFFDDETSSPNPNGRSGIFADAFPDTWDDAGFYDKQTLPILQRSLARTNSISSSGNFNHGSSETRLREHGMMSPTMPTSSASSSYRPRLRGRSITTPVEDSPHLQVPNTDFLSDGEIEDHSDLSHNSSSAATEGSSFMENVFRPVTHGARSGMRRLTGGGSKEEKRAREMIRAEKRAAQAAQQYSGKSPKVPNIPATYLQNPQSP